jgi:preprotein translocase subunit SecG
MTGPMITLILAAFVVVVGLLSYNARSAGVPEGAGRARGRPVYIVVLVLVVAVAVAMLWILHHRHGGDPSAFGGGR